MDDTSYTDEDGLDIEIFHTNPRDDQTMSLASRAAILDLDDVVLQHKDSGQLDYPVHKGMRILHFAVFLDRVDVVKLICDCGADVNAIDEVGYAPIHTASIFGRTDCLAMLLYHGAFVNNPKSSRPSDVTLAEEPIRLAIKNRNIECVQTLLENGARPDNLYFRGHELNIIDMDQLEIMELLLIHGASTEVVDRFGRTPLMKACKMGKTGAVNLLLKYGANPNARVEQGDQKSVFYWALKSEEMTLMVLQHGGDWTQPFNHHGRYNNTVVIIVSKGYVSCLHELLTREEFRINDLYQYRTPLGWLCMQEEWNMKHFEMLDILLDSNADPNFGCVRLESPLICHLRVMRAHSIVGVVRKLLNYGARIVMLPPEKAMFNFLSLDFSKWSRVPFRLVKILLDAAEEIDALSFIDRLLPFVDLEVRKYILAAITKPRSLKHIARTVIRNILLVRRNLYPDLVSLGPFPPNLMEYVLLEF